MSDPSPQFDDPSLKAALRTLRAGHQADPALRQRISALMTANVDDVHASVPSGFRVSRVLAIAAALIVCIGGVAAYLKHQQSQKLAADYAAQDELLEAMIGASSLQGDELKSPLTDLGALATEASTLMQRRIPVVDLGRHGWTLIGAASCRVKDLPAARFSFARGDRRIMVLSLPAGAWPGGKEHDDYSVIEDGHAIAGYIRSGSLNCVVGDESLPQAEANTLRDAIRGS